MILSNINQAHEYLPSLNLTLGNDRFTDFFRRAQEWLVRRVIGHDIEEALEAQIGQNQSDEHEQLRRLCQRVIAEKALLDAIPEMDMQLTEAGFAVQNNDDFSPASSQRVDRLMSKLPERITADTDTLVRYLIDNSKEDVTGYSEWRGTEQYKFLTSAFMPLHEDCSRFAPKPAETYDQFHAAIPIMAREMKKTAAYYVSAEEIDCLLEMYRDGEMLLDVHKSAIEHLKEVAVAAFFKDVKRARNAAVCARDVMLSDPDSFKAFKESTAYANKTIDLDGGKTVNFL